jgi:hypothetical protein
METAFFIGCIMGIILMGFALFASAQDFDNDQWKHKGY